jgi:2-hydroxychromene-2-carboxylate isomerase
VLTLYHDFTSPGSAVAVVRLQRLADEGLDIRFEPFEAIGIDAVLPLTIDVTAALDDVAEAAASEGLRLRRPAALPPTGLAHVVGALADQAGLGASWRQTCYRAFWERGADIGSGSVLVELAEVAGLSPDLAAGALRERVRLHTVRQRTAAHRADGVGGVPTILAQRTLVPGLLPESDLRALAALA